MEWSLQWSLRLRLWSQIKPWDSVLSSQTEAVTVRCLGEVIGQRGMISIFLINIFGNQHLNVMMHVGLSSVPPDSPSMRLKLVSSNNWLTPNSDNYVQYPIKWWVWVQQPLDQTLFNMTLGLVQERNMPTDDLCCLYPW